LRSQLVAPDSAADPRYTHFALAAAKRSIDKIDRSFKQLGFQPTYGSPGDEEAGGTYLQESRSRFTP
jgi:plasmid stabilization system protein ParE